MAPRNEPHILRDYVIAIGGAIFLAILIRFFLIETYRMPSRAMSPVVEPGDTLFVSKAAYGWRIPFSSKRLQVVPPQAGDVVVVEFPDEPGREYMKRVVGLPGDRVAVRQGRFILNGKDQFLAPRNLDLHSDRPCGKESLRDGRTYLACLEPPLAEDLNETLLNPGEFFVISDLRSDNPEPKRLKVYGKVRLEDIRGKARYIWLSVNSPQNPRQGRGSSRIRFDRLFNRIE